MFDLFSTKELNESREELQESINKMGEFHERLILFLLALKELNNPDVDRIFREHQVEIKES